MKIFLILFGACTFLFNSVVLFLKINQYDIIVPSAGIILVFLYIVFVYKQSHKLATINELHQENDTTSSYTPLVYQSSATYNNRKDFIFFINKIAHIKRIERLWGSQINVHFKIYFYLKEKPDEYHVLEILNDRSMKYLSDREKQILKSKFFEFQYYNENIQIIVDEHASSGKYSHPETWCIPKIGKPYLERAVIGIG